MQLIRLLYTSVAAAGFRPDDLRDVVEVSQRNNRRDGVTGFLTYTAPNFIQCLEGERAAVAESFERIRRDRRHAGVRILSSRLVEACEFADWSMELIYLDDEALAAVLPILDRLRSAAQPVSETAVEERLVHAIRDVFHRHAAGWGRTKVDAGVA